MTLYRSLTRRRLTVGACSEHGLGFQGVGRQNWSAGALWNLEVAIEAHQPGVLELVLPGLRFRMDWIQPRIGISMETVDVRGSREIVERRCGFSRRWRSGPAGC